MPEQASRQLTFVDALREALIDSMHGDQRVIVIGEGVPDPKAIFNTTAGLLERFGRKRVFDMPLSENGMTGVCIGAALRGLRPVMIHQRIDFALLAMDQIVNNAAKWRYMFNGKATVPIVIRMIIGRGWGQGPQHSQGLHAMFAQVPGLKVVMPSTPYDAKGMLLSSIKDENPVIFIEHRWLHRVVDSVPENAYYVPLDRAKVLKDGLADTATVAAVSYAAIESLEAARALSIFMGLDVEVVDMRSIRPLDHHTVTASVRKTGRLLVVDPAFETGSISGEIVYRITKDAFEVLKAAPTRLGLPDYPVPTSPFMTDGYYPGPQQIADAVLDLMNITKSGSSYGKLRDYLATTGRHDVPNPNFVGPF